MSRGHTPKPNTHHDLFFIYIVVNHNSYMGWRASKQGSRYHSKRKFDNINKTPEQTLRPTLNAFEISNDFDAVKNLYRTEIGPFIREFARLRNLAKKANIRWDYDPTKGLQANRFFIPRE